ncbi:MAG TPA: sigma-70 family RNA polymerase sigma factor [Terriglobia bacterium]|nr:sigma-70 family RNA polymerase sigma factor [Terriglobia bacterium]
MTSGKEADEQLLVEAAQKDPGCFAQLYEANFDRVYAYIAVRVCNRDEAEDLTAEVFHKALAHLGSFESRGAPFAAWLFRIAANAIADHSHEQVRRSAQQREIPASESAAEPGAPEELEEVERRAKLFGLVNALPADQRRVVTMRFSEEKSVREIAQEMGKSEGAVKQLQFRALERLRTRMASKAGGANA